MTHRTDEGEGRGGEGDRDAMQMYRAAVMGARRRGVGAAARQCRRSRGRGRRRGGRRAERRLNFRYFNRAAYSCNKSFLLGCP